MSQQFAAECIKGSVPIYSEKIWRNVKRNLDGVYPLTKRALGEEWEPLCRRYFREGKTTSPYPWQMPQGLSQFVEEECLAELLYFEWVEIEVDMMPNQEPTGAIHPDHVISHFHYPVFRVPYEELQEHRGDYYLLTYRHPEKLNVCFMELGPLYVVMIELLKGKEPQVLEKACQMLNLPVSDELRKRSDAFLQDLAQQQLLLEEL